MEMCDFFFFSSAVLKIGKEKEGIHFEVVMPAVESKERGLRRSSKTEKLDHDIINSVSLSLPKSVNRLKSSVTPSPLIPW